MEITTKELRIQPGKILEHVAVGQEITVTYRGKPLAKIIPYQSSENNDGDSLIFGMWKDHENSLSVENQLRELRKGRQF